MTRSARHSLQYAVAAIQPYLAGNMTVEQVAKKEKVSEATVYAWAAKAKHLPNDMQDMQRSLKNTLVGFLPEPGMKFPLSERAKWLRMAESLFEVIYIE